MNLQYSIVGTNIPNLITEYFKKVLGEIVKEQLSSAKDLDILHKLSTIHNVENIDSLIVEIDIRKQYLNNLIDKDIVKISLQSLNIGLVGIGVMGSNLFALNMSDNSINVKVYNKSEEKINTLINKDLNNKH